MISTKQIQITDNEIDPTISVSVKLYYGSKIINKTFELRKDEINEMPWCCSSANDPYFDDLKNNDDRFIYRVNDLLQHSINKDPALDEWHKWEIEYFGEYDLDDFIDK